jgi:RimJ/RimL family protein N-acetyltransferase
LQHDIRIEGDAFVLRPVVASDAAFVCELRSDPDRKRFIGASGSSVADQERWLEAYFARGGDYYFVVEEKKSREPHGALGIYDVDEATRTAEWGRWVLKHGSLAGPESVLLMLRAAFDRLTLAELYSRTLAANEAVVSFHRSMGFREIGVLRDYVTIGDATYDAIEHRVSSDERARFEPRLAALARAIAARMGA